MASSEEGMIVTVKENGACTREISVEVPAEKMTAAFEEALLRFRPEARLPGFRPGHAPLAVVRAHYGEKLREQIKEDMLSSTLAEAIESRSLRLVADPQMGEVTFEEGGPLRYVATLEVEPDIPSFEWKGLRGKRPRVEVSEPEIEMEVNRLRQMQAEYHPVERGAEPGDLLLLDYERCDTDDPVKKGQKVTNVPVELGARGLLPELEQGLRSVVKGTSRRIPIRYPDDYEERDLAGTEITLEVTVKEVKEKRLPSLDDEFAQTVGECATMAELRDTVAEKVRRAKERVADRMLGRSLFDALLALAPFEVPPTLVQAAYREILRGVSDRVGTEAPELKDPRMMDLYLRMAEREVKCMFLTREIARREGLEVTPDDVETVLRDMAAGMARDQGADPREVEEWLRRRGAVGRVEDHLREERVVQLLRENAEVEEASPV